jgi:hypothetical protein
MKNSVLHSQVKLIHPTTGLLTEQFMAQILHERNDIRQNKAFLSCQIQYWDRFIKVCDEKLGADLLRFIAMLLSEVVEEVGTTDNWLCQSDDDRFTIIDFSIVIPEIRKHLQQRFAAEALAREPFYLSVIKPQVDGDTIPTSLKLMTEIITEDDFFQIENQQGKEAS